MSKLPIFAIAFVGLVVVCNGMQTNYGGGANQPRVLIEKSSNMSPSMELDASDFLKDAIVEKGARSTPSEIADAFRDRYSHKHDTYIWHVVMYKAYSIQAIKSIQLKVDNDVYLLFATKK